MPEIQLRSFVSMCVVFLLVSSVLILAPNARALTWYEGTSGDFSGGTFSGTELVGSGEPAYIQILRDFQNWAEKTPVPSPSGREGPSMAYSPDDNVIVLFGGYDGSYRGDTWSYDYATNTWSQLSTTGSPPARSDAGMAYDTLNNVFVLFGGVSGAGAFEDTWEFDYPTLTWTETTPAIGPTGLASNPIVFDSTIGKVVLAAQHVGVGFETWTYDSNTQVWVNVAPFPSPPVRSNHALSFMSSVGRTVLFGGVDISAFEDKYDTWEYDGNANTWTETTPTIGPDGRSGHDMVYRTWDGGVLLFGGVNLTVGNLGDTWHYDHTAPTAIWSSIFTNDAPSPRRLFGMDYDIINNKTILFGGTDGTTRHADTWSLENAYRPQGTFVSAIYDTLYADTDWQYIWWNYTPANQPPQTTLRFHLATSNSRTGPWNNQGPDCSSGSYYTVPGSSICATQSGRYGRYVAYLISWDSVDTPVFDNIAVEYDVPATDPWIMATDPAHLAMGVDWWKNITVYFSEPMNTGTVTYTITPFIATTSAWDSTDSILYINHSTPLQESTWYTVEITGGTDLDGNPIDLGSSVTNPWSFLTRTVRPWIQQTEPSNLEQNIPLTYPIWINFSEPMDTASVVWDINPDEGLGWTPQWQNGDRTLYLTHSTDYSQCTWYQIDVPQADDKAGNPLQAGPVAVPWQFRTVCINPYISSTDPPNNAIGVDLNLDINITFSEEIVPASLTWAITPDEGLGWTPNWGVGNTYVVLDHVTDFSQCQLYVVEVTGADDVDGNPLMAGPVPNPFQFTTVCINPFVANTDPADGEEDVAIDADIVIVFSEAIDQPTFDWTINPDPGTWSQSWSPLSDMVTLSHTVPFNQCTYYTVQVTSADDGDGNPLIAGPVPNPWTFNTSCINPVIIETIPANDTVGVALNADIVVKFNKPMNTVVTWGIVPDEGLGWSEGWTDGDRTLTLSHTSLFTPSTKYTVSIISAQDTLGNPLVAGPVPNPFEFTTVGEDPYIDVTDPAFGASGVPVNYDITITFSEEIIPASVVWSINPDPNPGSWGEAWDPTNTILTLSHPVDFDQCTVHQVNVADAQDLDANHLVPGPVPNPWTFETVCINPFILDTTPADGDTDVLLDSAMVINFNEPMNTGTVTVSIVPFVGKTPVWSNGDRTLTLSPPVVFDECTTYNVTVTGQDTDGNGLISGPVPNPWEFTTICLAPYIVSTYPPDGAIGVPLDAPIIVNFSEPMDTPTVTWTISPDEGLGWTPAWTNGDMTLTLTHALLFTEATTYTVTITGGQDLDGLGLVPGPVPNPWSFTTETLSPYIVLTDPFDGETAVALDADIVIDFSEPMNTATVTWTINPDPGGWLADAWTNGDQTLTLVHMNAFAQVTLYTVTVTAGEDVDGNPLIGGPVPNPWTFTTGIGVVGPYIVSTYPADGAVNVPIDAPIIVNFSEPIDILALFTWTITPDEGLIWTETWTNGDQTLTLTHATPFTEDTTYTVEVTVAQDMDGNPLEPGTVPNPWSFTTMWDNPTITVTSPADGVVDVDYYADIIVDFSETMDTASLMYTVTPDPGGWGAPVWSNFDMTVTLSHSNPFDECTLITVLIYAEDLSAFPLVAGPVPNPWTFTVICENPWIELTDPADGQANVPVDADIVVTFSETMDTASLIYTINPDPGGWLAPMWSQTVYPDDTVTLSHSNPFDYCQTYTVTIAADDLAGLPLVAGPVPNPWQFSTPCELLAPAGLQIFREPPSNVNLTWSSVANATEYRVYESQDKFAPFPWALLGSTPETWFVAAGHLDDGLTHYYIVRAFSSALGMESGNSTMAAKISKDFVFNPAQRNIYWMSLPYVSEYATASDIATELTSSNINVIGRWDRQRQKTDVYFYTRGRWRGTDFAINAGDGIYIGAVATFTWNIVGTDSSVSLDFSFSPVATKTNMHWFSLPYTGNYEFASDIVADIEPVPGSPTKIVEVGKWDASTQSVQTYYYDGVGWSGVDFSIEPGDGIYIKVITSFSWQPNLITPEV